MSLDKGAMAELAMRSALDGKFYYFDEETKKTRDRTVPSDYIPETKPKPVAPPRPVGIRVNHKGWTVADDERLLELRRTRTSWEGCQKAMKRGITNLRKRYVELCAERGEQYVSAQPAAHALWSEEFKADLVRMRRMAMGWKTIARKAGVSPWNVRAYFYEFHPDMIEVSFASLKKREAKSLGKVSIHA